MVFPGPWPVRRIRDVWTWNFIAEFDELLAAVARCKGALIALDTEFPGFLVEDPVGASRAVRYWALRENVNMLRPIQFGFAVADCNGTVHGVWTFNLWFDFNTNLYTESSIRFLSSAGVDFRRHAYEGVDPDEFAWRLASSPLVGCLEKDKDKSPHWITFSGWYDWGYVISILTNRALPEYVFSFDKLLSYYCPNRHDLRDTLPNGSLDCLMAIHQISRFGSAHTAGSDALGTLELFLRVGPKIGSRRDTSRELGQPSSHLSLLQEHREQSHSSVSVPVSASSQTPAPNGESSKIEDVAAVKDSTSGDSDADRSEFEDEVDDDCAEVNCGGYESDGIDGADDIANPTSGEGCHTLDRARDALRDDMGVLSAHVCGSGQPALLTTFGIGGLVATLSSAFMLLQVAPTLTPLVISLPRCLARSLQSVALQKLSLVLSSFSIVVFGCFYLLF